jgi:hypothetical protein
VDRSLIVERQMIHETTRIKTKTRSSPIFLALRLAGFRMICDFVGINFLAGHTIFAVGPPAEVDQFATL